MNFFFTQRRCWQLTVYSVEWCSDLWIRNCRKCGRNCLWPNLTLCPCIFMDKMEKNYITAVKMDHCLCGVTSLEYSRIWVGITRSGLQSSVLVLVEPFLCEYMLVVSVSNHLHQDYRRTSSEHGERHSIIGKHGEFHIYRGTTPNKLNFNSWWN